MAHKISALPRPETSVLFLAGLLCENEPTGTWIKRSEEVNGAKRMRELEKSTRQNILGLLVVRQWNGMKSVILRNCESE